MGIDIYMKWDGQTKAEEKKQFTGYNVGFGHVGYLREAYHGEPYATKLLVKEAFAAKRATAAISAKVLRGRLPEVIKVAIERARKLYKNIVTEKDPVIKSFTDFVKLAEKMEKKTGKKVRITASY